MRLRVAIFILFFSLTGELFGQTVLNFPRVIQSAETFTGLAVSNPTSAEASITFAAFQPDGTAFQTPRTVTIPAGGQYARQFGEIFAATAPFNGWVQATSASSGLAGFFLNASSSITDVDGAGAIPPNSEFILPIASESGPSKTEVTLLNTNSEAAAVTATLYAADGTTGATKDLTLNGRALVRQTLQLIFGQTNLAGASHLRIRADRPIVGHEVVADFQIPRVSLARESIAVAGQAATAAQTYVLPQFVTGGGWASYLSVINANGVAQDVTLTAYKEDGTRWDVPINPKRVALAGNGSLKTTIEQLFELPPTRLSTGWIEVRAPLGFIVSNIGFGNIETPSFAVVSGVDAAQASKLSVYSQVAEGGGFFTGLTVVNPGREPAIAEFFTLRPDGTTVGRFAFTVGPGQRVGKLFRELLPASFEQLGGWAFLRSSQPVIGAVLFGSSNGYALANVPAQTPAGDFIPPAQSTAAITGTVHQDVLGAGDVTITLSGPVTATKITDASGVFAFTQLPAGQYKVSVSKTGAQFFPSERSVTLGRENVDKVDFDAVGIAPADAPLISFLTPVSVFGGNSAVNITILGSNFNQASVVRVNDQPLQTNFINSTELRAAVPASFLRSPGILSVSVFTPPPGGGASNKASLAINALPVNPLIEATAAVGAFPAGVAIHPVRKLALVTSESDDSVRIIDLQKNLATVAEVKVGRSPAEGIAIDVARDIALVANAGDDTVSIIDLKTNQAAGKIKVERFPTGVAINPQTNRAVVVNGESDSVSMIDLTSMSVIGAPIKVGKGPSSVAINARTNVAAVTNRRSNDVSIIDLNSGSVAGNVPVGAYPRGIAVNPNNNTAVVANANGNSVSLINLATRSVIGTIDVGAGPTSVAIHVPTSTAIVTNSGVTNGNTAFGGTNTVSIINLDQRQVVETVPVGSGAFGVDVDAETQKAVVANYASNNITVIRLPNPKPVVTGVEPKTFPAGGGAFAITVRGTGFLPTSVVTLNGQPLLTTFISSTELRAEVTPAILQQFLQRRGTELADGAKPGGVFQQVTALNFDVGVSNPGPGGGDSPPPSDPAAGRIQPQNAAPVLISLDPAQVTAGSGELRLTVSGNNFNATSQVNFGTAAHSPVAVTPTSMTVVIPANELRPGSVSVSVTNPPPGGGTTAALAFTVLESANPVPSISNIAPAELPAGSGATTVRISGSGFIPTTVLTVEGSVIPVSVTASSIEFTIPATRLAIPAALHGLMTNPSPGGGAASFNT